MNQNKHHLKATTCCGALMISAMLFIAACSPEPSLLDPVVQIEGGQLQGVANEIGTVVAFKGIPFAEPPVGELRWKEPQPPLPWDGVRDASEFGSSCMQHRVFSHITTGTGPWTEEFMVQNEVSEDCLFLNVWTPAKTASDNLSVLVYIHGGALNEGSGAIDTYDGEELAKKGIVVATINYRLNIFGFLAHPDLTSESPHGVSGNYGYLDQVAALKWVQQNIAAFGGNPEHVTVAGQSAGAGSVHQLISSPLASGLFHGAITQSGSSIASRRPPTLLSDAEQSGLGFAEIAGATSIADLRAKPAVDVLETFRSQSGVRFGGNVDGYLVNGSPKDVIAAGDQNDTPFITGGNKDESRYTGENSDAFFALYPLGADGDTTRVEKFAAEEQSRLNTVLWLEHRAKTAKTNGYGYFFERAIPWPEHPEFGAFHTGEVPYVFNNLKMLDRPWTAVDTMVADVMSSFWVNFVKNGDPNGEGLPIWNATDGSNLELMRIGEEMGMTRPAATAERSDFLKEQLLGNE